MTTLSHSTKNLMSAIDRGSIDCVRGNLRSGADPNALTDTVGTPVLTYAINKGAGLYICKALLEHGADPDPEDDALRGPLYAAAIRGDLGICKALIARGADPARHASTGVGPLHVATMNGHYAVCRYFVECGVDVCDEGRDGRTPLDFAVDSFVIRATDLLKIVQLFVENGASSAHLPSDPRPDRLTPFQSAINHGLAPVVRYFLENCGEDPRQTTLDGRTMIELAKDPDVIGVLEIALNMARTEEAIDAAISADPPANPLRCLAPSPRPSPL